MYILPTYECTDTLRLCYSQSIRETDIMYKQIILQKAKKKIAF